MLMDMLMFLATEPREPIMDAMLLSGIMEDGFVIGLRCPAVEKVFSTDFKRIPMSLKPRFPLKISVKPTLTIFFVSVLHHLASCSAC